HLTAPVSPCHRQMPCSTRYCSCRCGRHIAVTPAARRTSASAHGAGEPVLVEEPKDDLSRRSEPAATTAAWLPASAAGRTGLPAAASAAGRTRVPAPATAAGRPGIPAGTTATGRTVVPAAARRGAALRLRPRRAAGHVLRSRKR